MKKIDDEDNHLPEGFDVVTVRIHDRNVAVGLPTDNINQRQNLAMITDQIIAEKEKAGK